jgi:hypothetical protein
MAKLNVLTLTSDGQIVFNYLPNSNVNHSINCFSSNAQYEIECNISGAYQFFFEKNVDGFF